MRRGLVMLVAIVGCLASAQSAAAVAPETTIAAGPAAGSATRDNTPTFEFSANQPATFACSIDAGVAFACSSPYTAGPFADGDHSFTVTATNAGAEADVSPETRVFTIDTTPPETTITAGPPEGAVINDDAPQFGWASSELGSTFTCIADGVQLAACEQAFQTGARAGAHSFSVMATDDAGNADPTPATRSFTVSLQEAPPDLPACPLDGDIIIATAGDDTRSGTPRTDVMYGLAGNDLLRGGLGGDCLFGQSGDDRLFGGLGGDFVFGASGNDRIGGEAGNDRLRGEAGNDRITGSAGRDILEGGAGKDHISDFSGRDSFSGGAGDDLVEARDRTRVGQLVADSVRCGSGRRDVAVVDRRDRVARDCERVRRR